MKKSSKLISIAATSALAVSSLVSCNFNNSINQNNNENDPTNKDVSYNYVITSNGSQDVMFEISDYKLSGNYSSDRKVLEFTTKIDNQHFQVVDNWFLFDKKPSPSLYDISYGSDKWPQEKINNNSNNIEYKYLLLDINNKNVLFNLDKFNTLGNFSSDRTLLEFESQNNTYKTNASWMLFESKPPEYIYDNVHIGSQENTYQNNKQNYGLLNIGNKYIFVDVAYYNLQGNASSNKTHIDLKTTNGDKLETTKNWLITTDLKIGDYCDVYWKDIIDEFENN